MKKIILLLVIICAVFSFTACQDGSGYPLSLEQMILEDLINEYRDLIYTEEYAEDIDAFLGLVNDPKATSSDIAEAIDRVRQIKDEILNRDIVFVDKELEALVRLSLNIGNGGFVTFGDIMGVTSLDLSAREGHVINFIEDLSHFPLLEELDLSGNAITDFSALAKVNSLKTLNLTEASASEGAGIDLSVLSALPNLESLSVGSLGLTDLKFLQGCQGLTSLDVSYNPITDYSGLFNCHNLSSLNVSGGSFGSMSLFAIFPNLSVFTLENGTLTSLGGIESMPLSTLDLSGTKLDSCDSLGMVYSLRVLDLSDTGITSASCLAGHGISKLYLADNRLTDVSFLSSMGSLTTVDISGNSLKTLSITGQGSLTELKASDNDLTSVTLGGDMTYLTEIDLSDNDITYLDIGAAANLAELYLDYNDLTSASFITDLKALRVLSLCGNDIMSMPSLKEHKITHLYLTDLPISSLSFMADADTFVEVDLFGTDLVNISGLEGKTALRTLKIRVNNVSDLSVFETLQGVTDLSVYGTNDDFWPLLLNPNMQSLERLCITRSKITYAAVTGLENLKTLEIITCRTLTDLSRIHDLPALETLYVEAVDTYRPYVSGFENLKYLSIIDGHVENVENISELPACEYLDLSENTTFTDFDFAVLPSLKTLILSDCAISNTDLKKLNVVINMGALDLSKNSISKLKDFPFEADQLLSLDLSNNKISDFSPIYGLEIPEVLWSGNKGTYAPEGEE